MPDDVSVVVVRPLVLHLVSSVREVIVVVKVQQVWLGRAIGLDLHREFSRSRFASQARRTAAAP